MWIVRGRSWTVAISKMECFVIIVNGWKPLAIITKPSILDVAAALDLPLPQVALTSIINPRGKKVQSGKQERRFSVKCFTQNVITVKKSVFLIVQ